MITDNKAIIPSDYITIDIVNPSYSSSILLSGILETNEPFPKDAIFSTESDLLYKFIHVHCDLGGDDIVVIPTNIMKYYVSESD